MYDMSSTNQWLHIKLNGQSFFFFLKLWRIKPNLPTKIIWTTIHNNQSKVIWYKLCSSPLFVLLRVVPFSVRNTFAVQFQWNKNRQPHTNLSLLMTARYCCWKMTFLKFHYKVINNNQNQFKPDRDCARPTKFNKITEIVKINRNAIISINTDTAKNSRKINGLQLVGFCIIFFICI